MNGPAGDLPLLLWDGAPRVLCGQGPAPARGVGRALPRAGARARARDGLSRRVRAGRVRRLDAAAARFRDVRARRRRAVRDRLRALRLSRDARDRAGDRGARAVVDDVRALWGPVPGGRRAAAQPAAGGHLRAARPARAARRARRGSTPRATPSTAASSPRRSSPRSRCRRWTAPARAHAGVLTGDDLAAFAATLEAPVSLDFRGWTVFKTGPWGQGPVLLQQLALLDGLELGPFLGVEHVHSVLECAKLAFADREAFYGDSAPVPLERLLSRRLRDGAAGARRLSRPRASCGPGRGGPLAVGADGRGVGRGRRRADPRRHLPPRRRRPLRQPRLGDAERRLAAELARDRRARVLPRARGRRCSGSRRACRRRWWAGRRPRTTLSPSLALRDDGTVLAFGTPGGDQQDQWSLEFFLAHARLRARPAGGDRRADVPHDALPELVLPA